MFVTELSRRIGRTPETIKRWVDTGLLECERDGHNRRVFGEIHVERCEELARLGIKAQLEQRKLTEVVADRPSQLPLAFEDRKRQRGR